MARGGGGGAPTATGEYSSFSPSRLGPSAMLRLDEWDKMGMGGGETVGTVIMTPEHHHHHHQQQQHYGAGGNGAFVGSPHLYSPSAAPMSPSFWGPPAPPPVARSPVRSPVRGMVEAAVSPSPNSASRRRPQPLSGDALFMGASTVTPTSSYSSPAPSHGAAPGEMMSRILISNAKIGAVIGKGGSIVKHIREGSGAKVTISDGCAGMPSAGPCAGEEAGDRMVTMTGPYHCIASAFSSILSHAEGLPGDRPADDASASFRMLVPNGKAGGLIGRGGGTIKSIREQSCARIEISSQGQTSSLLDRIVSVTGTYSSCLRAHQMISNQLMDEAPSSPSPFSNFARSPGSRSTPTHPASASSRHSFAHSNAVAGGLPVPPHSHPHQRPSAFTFKGGSGSGVESPVPGTSLTPPRRRGLHHDLGGSSTPSQPSSPATASSVPDHMRDALLGLDSFFGGSSSSEAAPQPSTPKTTVAVEVSLDMLEQLELQHGISDIMKLSGAVLHSGGDAAGAGGPWAFDEGHEASSDLAAGLARMQLGGGISPKEVVEKGDGDEVQPHNADELDAGNPTEPFQRPRLGSLSITGTAEEVQLAEFLVRTRLQQCDGGLSSMSTFS